MTPELDAVVIGAGHNGLVAANLLVDAGWSVTVLERNDRIGGAVHSDTSLHDGYVTDWFSAFYPRAAASPVLGSLHLEDHGLRWTHAPAPLEHDDFFSGAREVRRRDQAVVAGADDDRVVLIAAHFFFHSGS